MYKKKISDHLLHILEHHLQVSVGAMAFYRYVYCVLRTVIMGGVVGLLELWELLLIGLHTLSQIHTHIPASPYRRPPPPDTDVVFVLG